MLSLKNLIVLTITVMLVGCSDLSLEEKRIVGDWYWHVEKGESGSTGYISLMPNRDITFCEENWWPNDRKFIVRDEPYFGWRVSDDQICVATLWEEGVLGKTMLEEDCMWLIADEGIVVETIVGAITATRQENMDKQQPADKSVLFARCGEL